MFIDVFDVETTMETLMMETSIEGIVPACQSQRVEHVRGKIRWHHQMLTMFIGMEYHETMEQHGGALMKILKVVLKLWDPSLS